MSAPILHFDRMPRKEPAMFYWLLISSYKAIDAS